MGKRGTVALTSLANVLDDQATVPMFELTAFQKRLVGCLFGNGNPRYDIPRLLDLYRRQYGSLVSVGLGNSANDLPMLRETDLAVLVRNPDSTQDAEITKHLPNVERTDAIGPRGWREAIDAILDRFGA